MFPSLSSTCFVAKDQFELLILLPCHLPSDWEYAPPCLAYELLILKPRALTEPHPYAKLSQVWKSEVSVMKNVVFISLWCFCMYMCSTKNWNTAPSHYVLTFAFLRQVFICSSALALSSDPSPSASQSIELIGIATVPSWKGVLY